MVCKVALDGRRLVARQREHVREASAREDDRLAGLLGRGDGSSGHDLRRTDRGDKGAAAGERRVESAAAAVVEGTAGALGLRAALAAVAGDAGVARRVEDRDAG